MSRQLAGQYRKRSQQMGIRIDEELFEQTKARAEALGFRGYTNYIIALLSLANELEDPIQVLELCQTPKGESLSLDELVRRIVQEELRTNTSFSQDKEEVAPTKEHREIKVNYQGKGICPKCGAGNEKQIKYGKNRQGLQRFYCNQCNKVYVEID